MASDRVEDMEMETEVHSSPPAGSKAHEDTKSGFIAEAGLPSGKAKEEERSVFAFILIFRIYYIFFGLFRFRYGNYNQYYGTRMEGKFSRDPRLDLMKEEWFRGNSVLDVGCNAGVFTLYIAKNLGPRRIVGLDIDPNLIGIARKNIRHYCDESVKVRKYFYLFIHCFYV